MESLSQLRNGFSWPVQNHVSISVVLFALLFIYLKVSADTAESPLINGKKPWELSSQRANLDFVKNGRRLLREGLKRSEARPSES
jgi:hypothetical protein